MAFISKEDPVVLNIMLTSKGRERISTGNLTFSYFRIGDSEIDYDFIRAVESDTNVDYAAYKSKILRPKDLNPKIISTINKEVSGDSYNSIETLSTLPYDVVNSVDSLGFFTSGGTYITQATHVKQPDIMFNVSGLTGGTQLILKQAPSYGQSILEPAVNDYLYVKWNLSGGTTTGNTVNANYPVPNLMYKIVSTTGTLAANNLIVTLDRVIPNLTGLAFSGYSGAMVFYSGLSETNIMPSDYLNDSVINFLSNYQCGIANYPFWNMSIIFRIKHLYIKN
jgi:hypothetical protein